MRLKLHIKKIIIKKAKQSICRYKVSAVGFNKKGEVIYTSYNTSRFDRKGGGVHAEMKVMKEAGPSLHHILICRTNKKGELLPIDPCKNCEKKAKELGVKIVSINENF